VTSVISEVLDILSAETDFRIFESVCETVNRTLTVAVVKSVIERDLARIRNGEMRYDAWSRPSYVVAQSDDREVNLVLVRGALTSAKPLVLARHSAIGVIAGGPLRLRAYRWTPTTGQLHLDALNGSLSGPEWRTLCAGEWFAAEAMSTCYEVIDADSPALCFRVQGSVQRPFHLQIDPGKAEVDGFVNAIGSVSRIEAAVGVLARIAPDALCEVYDDLCKHSVHTVRWLAAQIAKKADPASLPRVLGHLAEDPHPAVRSSARGFLRELMENGADGTRH
jgi:hypothetical protein